MVVGPGCDAHTPVCVSSCCWVACWKSSRPHVAAVSSVQTVALLCRAFSCLLSLLLSQCWLPVVNVLWGGISTFNIKDYYSFGQPRPVIDIVTLSSRHLYINQSSTIVFQRLLDFLLQKDAIGDCLIYRSTIDKCAVKFQWRDWEVNEFSLLVIFWVINQKEIGRETDVADQSFASFLPIHFYLAIFVKKETSLISFFRQFCRIRYCRCYWSKILIEIEESLLFDPNQFNNQPKFEWRWPSDRSTLINQGLILLSNNLLSNMVVCFFISR